MYSMSARRYQKQRLARRGSQLGDNAAYLGVQAIESDLVAILKPRDCWKGIWTANLPFDISQSHSMGERESETRNHCQ